MEAFLTLQDNEKLARWRNREGGSMQRRQNVNGRDVKNCTGLAKKFPRYRSKFH